MKRWFWVGVPLALSATLLSPAAHASGFALELSAGQTRFSDASGSLTDRATAVGLLGRYIWEGGFGLEAGIRGHGEWAIDLGGATARPDVTSYQLGLTYDLPVGPVTLGARLGAHAWRLRGRLIGPGSADLGKFEDSGGGLYSSLGIHWALSERTSLGVFYNTYRLEDVRLKGMDVRLAYRF